MRVVSMVPSWTETLIAAGVDVVGRTRFCIHPGDKIKSIPAVGGTKDWNWDKIRELKPDMIVLDKEENPKMMSEQQEIPFVATHVTAIEDMPQALKYLSQHLKNQKLEEFAKEWEKVLEKPVVQKPDIPAVLQWGRTPSKVIKKVIYLIWKNPWMTVSADTFVGSVLSYCGQKKMLPTYPQKYPQIDLENLTDKESTLLLFSSEPYPFLKKQETLADLGFPYAFVDGEKLSWFGIRSLRFLQSLD